MYTWHTFGSDDVAITLLPGKFGETTSPISKCNRRTERGPGNIG